jgi:hypothetical protein
MICSTFPIHLFLNSYLNLLSKSRFLYQSKIICKQNQHLLYIYKYNDKKQEKNLYHLTNGFYCFESFYILVLAVVNK